jgi:hypothetical protein
MGYITDTWIPGSKGEEDGCHGKGLAAAAWRGSLQVSFALSFQIASRHKNNKSMKNG